MQLSKYRKHGRLKEVLKTYPGNCPSQKTEASVFQFKIFPDMFADMFSTSVLGLKNISAVAN